MTKERGPSSSGFGELVGVAELYAVDIRLPLANPVSLHLLLDRS